MLVWQQPGHYTKMTYNNQNVTKHLGSNIPELLSKMVFLQTLSKSTIASFSNIAKSTLSCLIVG